MCELYCSYPMHLSKSLTLQISAHVINLVLESWLNRAQPVEHPGLLTWSWVGWLCPIPYPQKAGIFVPNHFIPFQLFSTPYEKTIISCPTKDNTNYLHLTWLS